MKQRQIGMAAAFKQKILTQSWQFQTGIEEEIEQVLRDKSLKSTNEVFNEV